MVVFGGLRKGYTHRLLIYSALLTVTKGNVLRMASLKMRAKAKPECVEENQNVSVDIEPRIDAFFNRYQPIVEFFL